MIKKLLLIILIIGFIACEKDEATDGEKNLVGTWDIVSVTAFGINIPGDGSYLTFNECGDNLCIGFDYEATGQTSGAFTYELLSDGSIMTIVDTLGNGGAYGGVWDITTFDATNLTISQTSQIGAVIINFEKNK